MTLFSSPSPRAVQTKALPALRDSLNRRSNRVDTFSITLTGRSSFNASLSGIKRRNNVDLELLNSSGTVVAASRRPGKKSEFLNLTNLEGGNYTLRATLKRGQGTTYNLSYSSTPFIPGDFAGNTPGTARSVGDLTTPVTFSDYVGSVDPNDFYSFSVGQPGSPSAKFSLSLTGVGGGLLRNGSDFGNVQVKLRNSLNEVIETKSSVFDGNAIAFEKTLAAGNYSVEVIPYFGDGGGDYSLSLGSTPIADFAGNTPATARNVALSSTPASFQDFVGAGDSSDFYKFSVVGSKTLNLSLTGINGNLIAESIQVKVRDGLNNVIKFASSAFDGASIAFTEPLTTGTYSIEVSPYFTSDSSDYILNLFV